MLIQISQTVQPIWQVYQVHPNVIDKVSKLSKMGASKNQLQGVQKKIGCVESLLQPRSRF